MVCALTAFVLCHCGRADSLYLIYNTYPKLEERGRYEITIEDRGYLSYEMLPEGQRSFAKIKNPPSRTLLRGRDYDTPFGLCFDETDDEEAIRRPVELARLIPKPDEPGCLGLTVVHGTGQDLDYPDRDSQQSTRYNVYH